MLRLGRPCDFGVFLALLAVLGCSSHTNAPRSTEANAEISAARNAFEARDPDLKRWFEQSHGYVLFPHLGKGGLIVGGGGGSGYVFERGTLVGTAKMSMVSAGAQAGGQSFREVIFFEAPTNLEHFKDGNFEVGAEVSAVAADAGAAKHARYEKGVLIFTAPISGLMAEATVKGQKFEYEPLAGS